MNHKPLQWYSNVCRNTDGVSNALWPHCLCIVGLLCDSLSPPPPSLSLSLRLSVYLSGFLFLSRCLCMSGGQVVHGRAPNELSTDWSMWKLSFGPSPESKACAAPRVPKIWLISHNLPYAMCNCCYVVRLLGVFSNLHEKGFQNSYFFAKFLQVFRIQSKQVEDKMEFRCSRPASTVANILASIGEWHCYGTGE